MRLPPRRCGRRDAAPARGGRTASSCDRAPTRRAPSPRARFAGASRATGPPRPRCRYSSRPPAGGRRYAEGAAPGPPARAPGGRSGVLPNRSSGGFLIRSDVNICSTQCDMSQEFSPVNLWRSSAYGESTAAQKRQMRSWDTRRRRGVATARPRHGRRLKAAADRRSRPERRELCFAEQGVFLLEQGAFAHEQRRLRAREPDALVGRRRVRRNNLRPPGGGGSDKCARDRPGAGGAARWRACARMAPEGGREPQSQCKEQELRNAEQGDVSAGTGNICS